LVHNFAVLFFFQLSTTTTQGRKKRSMEGYRYATLTEPEDGR